MADNNYDPLVIGGLQKVYCPICREEVKSLDSYHLDRNNQRLHYPECYQRAYTDKED